LYGGILLVAKPDDPDRDRFVLSKGHAALTLYAALFLKGWIDEKTLNSFYSDGTILGDAVVLSGNSCEYQRELVPISPESLQPINSAPVDRLIEARRRTALQLRSFDQNRFSGNLDCERSGILLFQTPFDPGWQAVVDGSRTKTVKADVGLLGVKLDKGKHSIEMRYRPPFLKIGASITLLSLLIAGVSIWRWPRITPALV
jgi:hypothetical protein